MSLLIASVLECGYEVAGCEFGVTVPITCGPASVFASLVRPGRKDFYEVTAVEFTVKIGIAYPGFE